MNWQQKQRSLIVYQRNLIGFSENSKEIAVSGKLKLYEEILRVQSVIDEIGDMSFEKSLMPCDDYSISAVSKFYITIKDAKKVPKVRKTWGLSI